MTDLTIGFIFVAIIASAIIYGTDVFCAVVMRPAAAHSSDSSVADLIGHVHEYGDRRLVIPGVVSVIATAATLLVTPSDLGCAATGVALVALLIWLTIYLRISAPINKVLRAAAATHTVPPETRALQVRWDTVIAARALLQTVALVALLVALLAA